jgi:hypothetical protein
LFQPTPELHAAELGYVTSKKTTNAIRVAKRSPVMTANMSQFLAALRAPPMGALLGSAFTRDSA